VFQQVLNGVAGKAPLIDLAWGRLFRFAVNAAIRNIGAHRYIVDANIVKNTLICRSGN
jgi:hypothetical protein